jgi:hypothetical protein
MTTPSHTEFQFSKYIRHRQAGCSLGAGNDKIQGGARSTRAAMTPARVRLDAHIIYGAIIGELSINPES